MPKKPKFSQVLGAWPPDPHLPPAAGGSTPRPPPVIHNLAERVIVAREPWKKHCHPPSPFNIPAYAMACYNSDRHSSSGIWEPPSSSSLPWLKPQVTPLGLQNSKPCASADTPLLNCPWPPLIAPRYSKRKKKSML